VDDVLLTATRQSGGTDRGSRRSSLSSRAQRGISAVKHATTELRRRSARRSLAVADFWFSIRAIRSNTLV
jgi:hypothetical protein